MAKYLTLLLFCIPVLTGFSQTFLQHLYWLRYQNQLFFTKQWYWNNEIDNRRFLNPDVQHQMIIHSHGHYRTKSGRWDLGGGLTYSLAYASRPETGYRRPATELRPVAEATYEVPLGILLIQQRVRLDARFLQADTERSVFSESVHVLRYRYRFQIRIPLKTNEDDSPVSSLRIADEIMLNNKKNTFDQHRIYVTADYQINKHIAVEAGYLHIYQRRLGYEEFFKRHVFRLSLLHKIFTKD